MSWSAVWLSHGEERCVTTLKRSLQPGMPCLFLQDLRQSETEKKFHRLCSQFREAWVRCPSTKTKVHPRNCAQSWCQRRRSESPSQPLGPESRNTPRSHQSVSIRHTFLKFLFHCFAVLSTRTNEQLALLVVIVYAAPITGKPGQSHDGLLWKGMGDTPNSPKSQVVGKQQ